jgi:hypothetical protein
MFLVWASAGLLALAFAIQSDNYDWLDTHRQKILQEKGHTDLRVVQMPSAQLQVTSTTRERYHTLSHHDYKKMKTIQRTESRNQAVRKEAAAAVTYYGYRRGYKAGNNLLATRQ